MGLARTPRRLLARPRPPAGVFVNPGYTRKINGLNADESATLLRMLFDLIGQPEFVCRFRWETGSVAMWDEHTTLHRGPQDFGLARRELHRFTIGATEPVAS